jgi:hypothetical protein
MMGILWAFQQPVDHPTRGLSPDLVPGSGLSLVRQTYFELPGRKGMEKTMHFAAFQLLFDLYYLVELLMNPHQHPFQQERDPYLVKLFPQTPP